MAQQKVAGHNSRRDFIKTTGAGVAGLAAVGTNALSYSRIQGTNDRVRIGLVGFSDRCKDALLPALMAHAGELNFEIVALSDIWSRRRDEGAAHLQSKYGKQIALARNNDELYARKDVDAVVVATADFQHAMHGVEAVKAGRDAYVEKPLAHTMADARSIRKAVEESKKIVQIGTQRRSTANYMRANEYIRAGKFGPIVMVEMTWNVNQPGRWRRPQLVKEIRREDTDWNRFQLNLPKEDWDPRKYVEFRLFWPYSSGIPDQWMVHQIDTVHWFTGLNHPRSVVAGGGIYQWQDGRKNFDTMTAVFDYGPMDDMSKGFQVVYSSRMTNEAGGVKEYYFSNGGKLDLDKNKITPDGGLKAPQAREMDMQPNLLDEMSLADENKGDSKVTTAASTGADPSTSAHVRNWMECVRERKTPNADVHAGYNHSVALCMTIAALQTGKRITFNDDKQEVVIG